MLQKPNFKYMEQDAIVDEINALHTKANLALENKDTRLYLSYFDVNIEFKNADGTVCNHVELLHQTERFFRKIKSISTTYYRIKFTLDGDLFQEKIARKSIVFVKGLLFSKKQTIQTEELVRWRKVGGNWKIVSLEITLEEKY